MFEGESFNAEGLRESLSGESKKAIVLLNFPNNPTGYSPTHKEVMEIKDVLYAAAEGGKDILVVLDDAYFGLFYDKGIYKESLFAILADLHERIPVAKIDGGSKEDYVLGFRIGFITFGIKGMNEDTASALELKTSGAIRGSISSAPNISQSLLLKAIESPTYQDEKDEMFELLRFRYNKVKDVLRDPKYSEHFSPLPYNSGYFLCVELVDGLDGEELRQLLLKDYSTGVISIGNTLRIAYSSVPENQIEQLFENIYSACKKLNL